MAIDHQLSTPADVRSRMATAISSWRHRPDVPPPFTCAELVVLALALHEHPLSDMDICLWILESFAFYRVAGPKTSWQYWFYDGGEVTRLPLTDEHEERNRLLDLAKSPSSGGIGKVLATYAVPVQPVEPELAEDGYASREAQIGRDTTVEEDFTRYEKCRHKWTIEPAEAALFLRGKLWQDEHAERVPFPFLRLPPDIRNIVYDMVLGFPPSGILINRNEDDDSGTVYAVSRSFDKPIDFNLWSSRNNWLTIGRIPEILSILSVNRQVRSEALHIFANINTFYFPSASHMARVLSRVPADHAHNIRQIAFHHKPGAAFSVGLQRAFRILAQMQRLQTLRIHLSEAEWRRHYYYNQTYIELMHFTRAPRIGEHVRLILAGDCPPEIETEIRAEAVVRKPVEIEPQQIWQAPPEAHSREGRQLLQESAMLLGVVCLLFAIGPVCGIFGSAS